VCPWRAVQGIHRLCSVAGIDTFGFWDSLEPKLLGAVVQAVRSQLAFTFVTMAVVVPAGAALRSSPTRRRLLAARGRPSSIASRPAGGRSLQQIPRWLEVIVVAGGTDPSAMYWRAVQGLT
jgi:hypothetical protein